jgi:hypothetical protein
MATDHRIEVLEEFAAFSGWHHDEEWSFRSWHEHRAIEGQAERNRAHYLRLRSDREKWAAYVEASRARRAQERAARARRKPTRMEVAKSTLKYLREARMSARRAT